MGWMIGWFIVDRTFLGAATYSHKLDKIMHLILPFQVFFLRVFHWEEIKLQCCTVVISLLGAV